MFAWAYADPMMVLLVALAINIFLCNDTFLTRTHATPQALANRAIDAMERRYNRPELTHDMRKQEGMSSIAILLTCALLIGIAMAWGFDQIPYGWVLEALAIASLLPIRRVLDVSRKVRQAMDHSEEEARATLGYFLGRDATTFTSNHIARDTIYFLARMITVGLIAPLLWYAVFGLPGLLVMRITYTASRMIDEQTPYTACFGWAPARIVEILVWPAARLTAPFIWLAALFLPGTSTGKSIRAVFSATRNGTWNLPVAAMLGALDRAVSLEDTPSLQAEDLTVARQIFGLSFLMSVTLIAFLAAGAGDTVIGYII